MPHKTAASTGRYVLEVMRVPHHKARDTENRQNKSSILEKTVAAKPKKQADYPPNLNEIAKNET
ncbi:hypothetical protein HMSSN036_16920 [Paenibacillus macerans]|uniref:hypothetical protein n=1 Tax=Paenibacillus macerans TaxID=44252 RepID=UPI0012D8E7EA|nr:hypothetical protein [Paenibacillus macerans]MBS5910217.1 hypothetical protein [Paenibacillus macerans]MEC0329287.1 hypothetical protein [Paenibacillus macerans]UMV51041.1 hypothetical protein LMZ02_10850 [Paenibacillus macerans]GJM69476.1 hypothetical protein HMSSN036_16920 [Paenibacillus macerans]